MSKSKTNPKNTVARFAFHSLKRTIYIWLIVLGVIAAIYYNAQLAFLIGDYVWPVAKEDKGGWNEFVNDLLQGIFFLLVPGSLIGGACWADDEDKLPPPSENPSGSI